MRLLFDSCMAPADAEVVRSAGHDVVWAGAWDLDPGDPEVLRRAFVQDRVLVTLDKDFGALVFRRRMPHAGMIYLRNSNPLQFASEILRAIEVFGPELETRGVVVFRKFDWRLRQTSARSGASSHPLMAGYESALLGLSLIARVWRSCD